MMIGMATPGIARALGARFRGRDGLPGCRAVGFDVMVAHWVSRHERSDLHDEGRSGCRRANDHSGATALDSH
ncbi:MAG: hypothetical protein VB142_10765 [Burkholderia sp.]